MKSSPNISSFNAGEWSPSLAGRSDLAKYANSCKLLQNFIPRIQGPITRRGGSHYAASVKTAGNRGWLVRFEYSATQAWVLEFGDFFVRFFTNHGQVTQVGSAWSNAIAYDIGDLVSRLGVNYYCILAHTNQQPPNATYWYPLTGDLYEVPSPYALADLTNADGTFALKVVQSGDVLYIANQKRIYQPRKLTRYHDTNWQFETYDPNQGPFLELNTTATTIYASGVSGSVTLTASAALFAATDIGRLVRLEVLNLLVVPWESGKPVTTGDLYRSDGKIYRATTTTTTGTVPPVHEHGTARDGVAGVTWQYEDSSYGVCRITAFTSSTVVTASVITDTASGLRQLPFYVVSATYPTTRWNLGAWSATTEYPATVTFFRNRLWWGGRQRLWGSVPNDFENMAGDFFGETGFDNAIWWQLQSEDVNDILWLAGDDRLIIGTPGGEFVGGEITNTDPLGPANFKTVRTSKRRSRAVQPVAVGDALCFVQRAGRRLLSMAYKIEADRFLASDLAVLAERMTRRGIIDMAYQSEAFSIIWCVLAGGSLVGFTYEQEQDVSGWHRHPIGGNAIVESVVSIPAPDGLSDELWMICRRTINGATVRYVEYMSRPWEGADNDGSAGDDQEDAFYVDSGLTYEGVPADVMSGLEHLEGETVQILADGAVHPALVVSSGQVTLSAEASVVHIGLACPARMVSNDLEAGGSAGTSQGKASRIYRAAVRFVDTLGGKIGMPAEDLSDASTLDEIHFRMPAHAMDEAPPIFTGVVDVVFPGDWERERRVEVLADQPLPMTVAAIMPRLHANDR